METKHFSQIFLSIALLVSLEAFPKGFYQSCSTAGLLHNVEESQHSAIIETENHPALRSLGNKFSFVLNKQQWNPYTTRSTALKVVLALSLLLLFAALVMAYMNHHKIKKLKKRIEETRKALAAKKEELISVKESLYQANEGLKKTKDELATFSYSISHDLRAPLRAIEGFTTMLMEDHLHQLDEGGKKALTTIRKNSNRMNEHLNSLLELARLETVSLTRQTVNMHQLVEQVLRDKIGTTKTKINLLPLDDAEGDPNLLRQVWQNLISNAIKFSSKNEMPAIEIGSTKKNNELIYRVKDNGVGFDPDYSDKLFQVFSRLHSKKEFEGSGAGLAMAKKIVNAHGGHIWAESELSKGAQFFFSLPLR